MPSNVISITTVCRRCFGLMGTDDITPWQQGFLETVARVTRNGDDTSKLSEKQIATLQALHDRHFEG